MLMFSACPHVLAGVCWSYYQTAVLRYLREHLCVVLLTWQSV